MKEENERIARDWRSRAVTDRKWAKSASQTNCINGEAGGYFVTSDGFNRRAYLKPANPHPDAQQTARAAREKIASDLAFDLGLTVPPAQLYELDTVPEGCETAVVISLVMYPLQHSWELVKTHPPDQSPSGLALADVLRRCSPMLVFDSWLQQTDHGDHPHNIIWGYNPSRIQTSEIVFLDYAFSMGFRGEWQQDGWNNFAEAPFPLLMKQHLDERMVAECAEKILNLDDGQIGEIVHRVPDTHLDDAQKQVIYDGLLGRRRHVADLYLRR